MFPEVGDIFYDERRDVVIKISSVSCFSIEYIKYWLESLDTVHSSLCSSGPYGELSAMPSKTDFSNVKDALQYARLKFQMNEVKEAQSRLLSERGDKVAVSLPRVEVEAFIKNRMFNHSDIVLEYFKKAVGRGD